VSPELQAQLFIVQRPIERTNAIAGLTQRGEACHGLAVEFRTDYDEILCPSDASSLCPCTSKQEGPSYFLFADKWLNKAKVIRKLLTNLGLLTRAVKASRFSGRNIAAT